MRQLSSRRDSGKSKRLLSNKNLRGEDSRPKKQKESEFMKKRRRQPRE